MMDSFYLVLIKITNSYNFGTSVQVNILKISTGMKVYHQINHALFTPHNSRRDQVILSFQEGQDQTKLNCLMLTICLNHVPRLEVLVELALLLISAMLVTNSLLVAEMV